MLQKLAILIVRKKETSVIPFVHDVARLLPQYKLYTEDNLLMQFSKSQIIDLVITIGGDGTIL